MNKDAQVAEIMSYVDTHKDSIEAKRICAMILGEKDTEVDDDLIGELHARLPRAKQHVIENCINIIR